MTSTDELTYTNTSLATARRCLTEFDLRYVRQLERDGEDREALQVGQAWHRAFHVQHQGGDPYAAIVKHAPGPLWAEKLRRLFAAYGWYWRDQALAVVEAESTFRVVVNGVTYEGQRDVVLRADDGRTGVVERKTTGDSVEAESSYWDRLRLDVQVGLYASVTSPPPSFILYDVVRKPTIQPKGISAKDAARMRGELARTGSATYFERFDTEVIERALELGAETVELYGARLTADIGDRPNYYFARREVTRTDGDYRALLDDLDAQVEVLEHARRTGRMHRNPDACNAFGLCDFFALCSRGAHRPPEGKVPEGYRRREHLHPELHPDA